MKKILIAVDNEDGTNEMLDYAAKMASLYDATLYILHIARPDPEFVGYDVGPEYIRLDAARNYRNEHRWVQELAKKLDSRNIDARALLVQGYVSEAILEQADDIDADLVICGSHKNGFFYNLFMENTAVELSKKSKRPLLFFPMPD